MGELRYGMLAQPSYVYKVFTDWMPLHHGWAYSLPDDSN